MEYRYIKCWEVSFFHILRSCDCVKFMADGLRTGMDCKVLGAGSGFHNFAIALEPFYKRDSQLFRKVRIFTVSFMSPSPSWITENIYVW